jgi:hypothetical protein
LLEQRLHDADTRRQQQLNTKQAAVQAQNTKWAEAVLEMRRAIDEEFRVKMDRLAIHVIICHRSFNSVV